MNDLIQSNLERDVFETIFLRAKQANPLFAEAIWIATTTRWFDKEIMSFLLMNSGMYLDDIFEWLTQRPFVELFNLTNPSGKSPRYTIHNKIRQMLLVALRKESPSHFYYINEQSKIYHEKKWNSLQENNASWLDQELHYFEMVYHWLSIEENEAFDEVDYVYIKLEQDYDFAACNRLLSLVDEQVDCLNDENLSWLQYYNGRLLGRKQKWQESLTLLEPLQNNKLSFQLETYLLHSLVDTYIILEQWERVITICYDLTSHYKKIENTEPETANAGIAQLYNSLGKMYLLQVKWDLAQQYFQKTLTIYQSLKYKFDESKTLIYIGQTYRLQGEWANATKYCWKAINLFRKSGFGERQRIHGEAEARNTLGNIYQMQGRWRTAQHHLMTAKMFFRDLGDQYAESIVITNLAELCVRQGKWKKALNYLDEAAIFAQKLHDKGLQLDVKILLGATFEVCGDWEESEKYYLQSLDLCHEIGQESNLSNPLSKLADLYRTQGRWQDAAKIYTELSKVSISLADKQSNTDMAI